MIKIDLMKKNRKTKIVKGKNIRINQGIVQEKEKVMKRMNKLYILKNLELYFLK